MGNNLKILRSPPLPVLVPPPEEEGLERLEVWRRRERKTEFSMNGAEWEIVWHVLSLIIACFYAFSPNAF